jgi:hypothetical protein
MKTVVFTSKREAKKEAKRIGGTVVDLVEIDWAVAQITPTIFGAFDDGFAKGYEQAKTERREHA